MMYKNSSINTRKKLLALAIGCALSGGNLHAQEEAPTVSEDLGENIEEIVVRGVRASQAKAIDIKRQSANVVDSIVAEDIGKLPDVTITDSLQRVTGVQITREANEGTTLNVRGMPQVLTTLNGEQFLSPWAITGVQANYSDIPAGMISGVDVYKSQSASSLAGGISGLIDLKTFRPFDLKEGWTGNLRLEGSQGSLSDEEINKDGTTSSRDPDHNVSLFLGHNLDDKLAFTLGGFHSTSYGANYAMYEDQRLAFLDQQGGTPADPEDLDGDGDTVNDWYMVPAEFGARSNFMDRERTGGALSAEFQINDNFSVRGDAFYTHMEQYDRGVKAAFNGRNSITSYESDGTPATDPTDIYNALLAGSMVGEGSDFTYVDANGVTQTRTINTLKVAEVLAPDFQTISTNQITKTAALNTNLQLDYTNNDNIEASLRYVYAEAEREYRNAQLQQGTPAWLWVDDNGTPGKDPVTGYRVTVDYRGDIPSFAFNDDLSDTDLLKQYQGFADGESTDATLNIVRADFKMDVDNKFMDSLEGGLRYGVREANHSKFYYVTPTARYSTWDDPRVPADKRYTLRSGNQIWQKYPEWLKFNFADTDTNLIDNGLVDNGFSPADTVAFSDFGPIKGFEAGVSAVNPADWDNPLDFMNRLYPGTRTVADPGYTYGVEEASTSGHIQLNFVNDEGIFGVPFQGNVGVQVVRTDRTIERSVVPEVLDKFNSIGYDDWQKIAYVYDTETIEKGFTDVLPSFNINFFPSDDTVVRFGAAKTTTRNDLDNVGSGLVLWYQQCPKTDENGDRVEVIDTNGNPVGANVSCVGGGNDDGNPDIKPWSATVYNSSVEWYFDENAILGAGLFLIDVDTAVETFQEQRNFVDGDGINRGNMANIWTTRNVGASDLYGLELGYKHPFTFLPGEFLSSTGIEFNYTYSHSESSDADLNGKAFPLPSNSEHQSNMILWYDKDGLNARLAYNWRSKEYLGRVGLNTNETPVSLGNWLEPTGYLDLSVSYWLNDHVSFYFNGTNLTEESRKSYAQYEDQFHSLWVQERRFALGVTLTL